ncbi:DNA polymerase III subunit delta' [Amylibacter sp.]|nr:DNA polymerase III subunit delta' [Amylibacter sp.]MDB3875290.1 DNA polymerase III subunit delta' [Amylibacter sp.]
MNEIEIPEADRQIGTNHPRHTQIIYGHHSPQLDFLDAYKTERLHHAWMITGSRGIGKATLGYKIAKFILSQNQSISDINQDLKDTLDIQSDHPVSKRINALGEPNLYLVRRLWDEKLKKFKQNITVDEIRKLKNFFSMSAADGGWRVAIIDAADEMNNAAANALLKILEEPPKKVLILLISHQPLQLMPTIRSRCRSLKCNNLSSEDLANALEQLDIEQSQDKEQINILANGSVGSSVELISNNGIEIYNSIVQLAKQIPQINRQSIQSLADSCAGKNTAERYEITLRLFMLFISRLAKFGALQKNENNATLSIESKVFHELAPDTKSARKWADFSQIISERTSHARAVNLDPSMVILDMLLQFEETSKKH